MGSTTIRVSEKTHRTITRLARKAGISLSDVVDQAVEQHRRQRILRQANAEYAALQADPQESVWVQAEREAWSATVADGLERAQAAVFAHYQELIVVGTPPEVAADLTRDWLDRITATITHRVSSKELI